ncbi:polysaccharide pyruvyl transferase [Lacticaseibacillus casei A2-362]|nr:polysaccharide pyruvyl transferase [Lacticaseibacillus casei A2-362]
MTDKYVIIPGCCDLNRGDQALGWETARIAKDAGFSGDYSVLAERDEPVQQSIQKGFEILRPVLEHPARKFSKRNNIQYGFKLKVLWGIVSVKDLIVSLLLLVPVIRNLFVFLAGSDSETKKTIERINSSSAVFMKGGGLIQSHGGLTATYATYYRLYHIFLAHSMKKPVYIMPNSFGPFEGPGVKKMVSMAFKECSLITAREKKSQEVVKNDLGIDIEVYPDLAFYLPEKKLSKKELFSRLKIPAGKKVVAITMRPYRFPDSDVPEDMYRKFKSEMRNFILWLNQKGYVPLIIEHTFAVTAHESDGDCIQGVISGLSEDEYYLLSDRTMNCEELKSVYSMCDYIVGTRFHSLIFSLSNRVPGIAISYDGNKSVGIMTDMGLKDFVIDIYDVNAKDLEKMFTHLVATNNENIKKIDKYIEVANQYRKRLVNELISYKEKSNVVRS